MVKQKQMIVVISLIAALGLSACAKQKFVFQGGGGKKVESSFSHFFVAGLGQTHRINAAQICGGASKVVQVEAQLTFLNWLVGLPTFGLLYTPRQYRVYCKR